MTYLFNKDKFRQSLRLALAGAWNHSCPDIIRPLALLQSKCPTLMDKYISSDEDGLLDLQEKAVEPIRCFGSRSWLRADLILVLIWIAISFSGASRTLTVGHTGCIQILKLSMECKLAPIFAYRVALGKIFIYIDPYWF